MRKTLLILLGSLGLGVAGAFGQASVSNIVDTGLPVLDAADILPVAGTVVNETKVVFSGSATDVAGTGAGETVSGVDRVEYRISGYKTWRRATLTARGSAATDFFFTVSIHKGTTRTVFIRVKDRKRNESDTIGRRVTHSKIIIRASSGTDSGTGTPPIPTPFGG
jgi:hypothetical protein